MDITFNLYRLYDAEPKNRRLFQAPRFGNVVITQIIAWGGSRCPVIRTKTKLEISFTSFHFVKTL